MSGSLKQKIDAFLARDFSDKNPIIRRLLTAVKISFAAGRDLADGQLSLRAMSLVYTTLITFVPLLAISFSVLKGFGVHNEIEPWLLNYLAPLGDKAQEIADKAISFVDNIKVGVLGAVGFFMLIYSVIALMQKIEHAFNFIWRVNQSRSLVRRFSDYLSVLVFGPFLLFLSAGLTTTARSSGFFDYLDHAATYPLVKTAIEFAAIFVPYLVMAGGFCFFYIFMPNTKVKAKAAFIGGLFTALVWKIMGWGFANVIGASAAYVAIYAAFATIIIFMVWVYLSWLVILMGANIAFYVQNPKYVRFARADIVLSNRMRMAVGLSIMEKLAHRQYESAEGVQPEEMAKILNMPMMAVQNMFEALERGHVVVTTETSRDGRFGTYFPARPLDQMTLGDVIAALECYAEKSGASPAYLKEMSGTSALIEALDNVRGPIMSQTVKEAFLSTPQI